MKTLTVGNLKSHFSEVIEDIRKGHEVLIEFGKKHEKLAVIVPYKKFHKKKRKIGLLEEKASFKIELVPKFHFS